MAATVHQIAVKTPQPAPQDPALSFGMALYEAGLAEGRARAWEEITGRRPSPSLLSSHTDSACAKILSLARQ